jgi:HD-GYP domain-containing protein (c-di-GMP phosphodiesterase class II)
MLQHIPGLGTALAIVRFHHERFDGTGYPDGLKGAEIPVEARVLAVADAWDGMVHDRPDGVALPRRDALATLQDGAGTRFCPEVVAAFVRLERAGVFEG